MIGRLDSMGGQENYQVNNTHMLYTLAVILVILWALGFLAFNVAGGLIHLLLVIAVVVILLRVIRGENPFR